MHPCPPACLPAAAGTITSAWSFGGAFITFKGRIQKSSASASRLARVNGAVAQGATRIPVRGLSC